jgi:hypothetical protein
VLGAICRLASTRLPLGKSCEFSVQGSGLDFNFSRLIGKVVDSPRLTCLLANRASSVFRVQGELDFNFSRLIVLTQSFRLACLGKSSEFSVQGSGWVGL